MTTIKCSTCGHLFTKILHDDLLDEIKEHCFIEHGGIIRLEAVAT